MLFVGVLVARLTPGSTASAVAPTFTWSRSGRRVRRRPRSRPRRAARQPVRLGSAPDARIRHLIIRHFGHPAGNSDEGVVTHDSATARAIRHNEIAFNNTDDRKARRPGCGCARGGNFWSTSIAAVVSNWVHDNHSVGLWMDTNNTGLQVDGNFFVRNAAEVLGYETGYKPLIRYHSLVRNALPAGRRDPGFPTPALYISESGSYPRAGARYGDRFRVTHNRWHHNASIGSLRFMVHQLGHRVTWRVWHSAPSTQDRGSTRRG